MRVSTCAEAWEQYEHGQGTGGEGQVTGDPLTQSPADLLSPLMHDVHNRRRMQIAEAEHGLNTSVHGDTLS